MVPGVDRSVRLEIGLDVPSFMEITTWVAATQVGCVVLFKEGLGKHDEALCGQPALAGLPPVSHIVTRAE